jgi:hypothetical protein
MTDRQLVSAVKFLYNMAKGVGMIAVVGGLVSGPASATSVIFGLECMGALYLAAFSLEGRLNS